jgi:hypothetical protein
MYIVQVYFLVRDSLESMNDSAQTEVAIKQSTVSMAQ